MKRMNEKIRGSFIGILVAVMCIVILLNVLLIYSMSSNQIKKLGKSRIDTISMELEGMVTEAKGMASRLALGVEFLMNNQVSQSELEKYVIEQKEIQKESSEGVCLNVYVSNGDWTIIPDYKMPEGFRVQDRMWYTGIVGAKAGTTYISPPYQDAVTGRMCFSVSQMLSDEKTIVGLDFDMSSVQKSIEEMCSEGDGDALIVNQDGLIVGYTDELKVGVSLSEALPQYQAVFRKIVSENNENMSIMTEIEGKKSTVFCSRTENDWYLILSVNDWALYKESYFQIIRNSVISLILLAGIIILYLMGQKNRIRAEKALAVKETFLSGLSKELRVPLHQILKCSDYDLLRSSENLQEEIESIHESGVKLSGMLDNLFSYSSIMTTDKQEKKSPKKEKTENLESKVSIRIRRAIILILTVALLVTTMFGAKLVIEGGNTKMQKEVDGYQNELSKWMGEHKSIVDMFVNSIVANPKMLENYEETVSFLNQVSKNYSEISASYLVNPNSEHTVIMNSGWEPEKDHVMEASQWYIDTKNSETGFNISAPYYDTQKKEYCVTFSEMVYSQEEEFLGVFAIDFYMVKLTEALEKSYTEDGYAFLTKGNGVIINHPNPDYQLTSEKSKNMQQLAYKEVYNNEEIKNISDYDGKYKVCIARYEESSDFRIVVVKDWWSIYGNLFVYGIMLFLLFGVCIGAVFYLIKRLVEWQNGVNIRLQDAVEEATQAGKAKSQFLAQMSHEIRTPINAVLGMNEMILRENDNEEIREYSENIRSAGQTLLNLINSILDFSKIEDGKMEIIPVKYDTSSLINDLVNMVADRAEKKGLLLQLEIDPKLPKTMYGDDARIRQVITNLLTNAVKYTPKGSVTLRILDIGRNAEKDVIMIRVEVEDTGIGIREEDMDKLYLSFQRLDEERNRNIEGTGLGISIVQKFLNMMGSELEVRSVYGKGSVFSFTLEQRIVEDTPINDYVARRKESILEEAQESYVYAPDANVLIVDDNQMNLKVAAGLLKRTAIQVDKAQSGRECIEKAEKKRYDIIFMDHMMPEMDGIETLKKLREKSILPESTSVIMMTANAIVGAKEEYLAAGFDDYLSKPIEIKRLEKILKNYLPKEKVGQKQLEVPVSDKAVKRTEENRESGLLKETKTEVSSTVSEDRKESKAVSGVPKEEKESEAVSGISKEEKESEAVSGISKEEKESEPASGISKEQKESQLGSENVWEFKEVFLRLRNGIAELDVAAGLRYCGESERFYLEMLREYVMGTKEADLEKYFKKKNWEGYSKVVHSIKSDSRLIGAGKLAERAFELEQEAREGKVSNIKVHHKAFLTDYERLKEALGSCILS